MVSWLVQLHRQWRLSESSSELIQATSDACAWDKEECTWRATMKPLLDKTIDADMKKADAIFPTKQGTSNYL